MRLWELKYTSKTTHNEKLAGVIVGGVIKQRVGSPAVQSTTTEDVVTNTPLLYL